MRSWRGEAKVRVMNIMAFSFGEATLTRNRNRNMMNIVRGRYVETPVSIQKLITALIILKVVRIHCWIIAFNALASSSIQVPAHTVVSTCNISRNIVIDKITVYRT